MPMPPLTFTPSNPEDKPLGGMEEIYRVSQISGPPCPECGVDREIIPGDCFGGDQEGMEYKKRVEDDGYQCVNDHCSLYTKIADYY